MTYCKNCIQVNPLPKCLAEGNTLNITNIVFQDNPSSDLFAILHNISSDITILWQITTDIDGYIVATDGNPTNGLDITSAFDLMNHSYEIEFTNTNLEPVTATINDITGCCIKFKVLKELSASGDFELSTGTCNA
jgi:uncharacterized membrane protein affecting hemolysin expression